MIDFSFEPYLRLLAAFLLALPIAWDRERSSRIMGLRAFPLVAVGSCAYILVGQAFIGGSEPNAMARIVQGLMSGIGFVGGGAILKSKDHISGTTSAASIWVTGALGAAAGFGYWGYAIALSVINIAIVFGMSFVKPHVIDDTNKK